MSVETISTTPNTNVDNSSNLEGRIALETSEKEANGSVSQLEENGEKPKSAFPKRSRIPCRFFMNGFCKYADECTFSHVAPCKYFLQGTCKYGDKCRYAHNTSLLFPAPGPSSFAPNGTGDHPVVENGEEATGTAVDTADVIADGEYYHPRHNYHHYDSYYYETFANSYLSTVLEPYESQYYKASGVLPLRVFSDPQRGGAKRILALMSGERRRESQYSSKRRLYLNFLGGLRSPRDVDAAMTAGRECCQRITSANHHNNKTTPTSASLNQFLPSTAPTPEGIAEALRTPPRMALASNVAGGESSLERSAEEDGEEEGIGNFQEIPHIYWFRNGKYVLYLWSPMATTAQSSLLAANSVNGSGHHNNSNGHSANGERGSGYENSLHWVDVDVLMDAMSTAASACVMVRTEDGALVEVFDLVKGALKEPQLFSYLKDYLCIELKK